MATLHASFPTTNLTPAQITARANIKADKLSGQLFVAATRAGAMVARVETHIGIQAETCQVSVVVEMAGVEVAA